MDFYSIREKSTKRGTRELYPEFREIGRAHV